MKPSVAWVARVLVIIPALFVLLAFENARGQTDSTVVDSTITPVDSTVAPAPVAPPPPAAVVPPTPATTPPPAASPTAEASKKKHPMFFGGTVGMSFGDYTSVSIEPMVGWKLTPRVGAGFKATYEYVKDKRYSPTMTASNYGGSVFGQFYPVRLAYAHAEFAYINYEYSLSTGQSERNWVPFLLLGGGIIKPINARAALTVEVLFDVLQDDHSPYEDWAPFVSVGVGVGL